MLIYVAMLCTYFTILKVYRKSCTIKCDDINCISTEHSKMIDLFKSHICCALEV